VEMDSGIPQMVYVSSMEVRGAWEVILAEAEVEAGVMVGTLGVVAVQVPPVLKASSLPPTSPQKCLCRLGCSSSVAALYGYKGEASSLNDCQT